MLLSITAKPGSKIAYVKKIGGGGLFGKPSDEVFIVAVREPAKEGKANRAIEKALAAYFKVPVSRVRIVSGHAARKKIVEI